MKNSRIKKYLRITVISAFFLFCASALSGCGHYSRRETAEWFQQNVVDEGIFVSKEYTEREGDDGYTDRIWSAHLKELPEVEFELISNKSLSLFPYYDIETTYYLEIGRYYLIIISKAIRPHSAVLRSAQTNTGIRSLSAGSTTH